MPHFATSGKRQKIAVTLLGIWLFNLISPLSALALTSGPSQPEAQSFQPAGVTEMVDLSSGDFKYNIPLLDVDGYPVNLNYQSGVGMDDEASWTGLGWNVNIGAVNRQLRGLPDDHKGDEITTEHWTKPKVTIGGRLSAKVELGGNAKVNGSVSVGVFSDNYTGVGGEVGANVGLSVSLVNDGALTAGLGLGVMSSTATGAGIDLTPSINMNIQEKGKDKSLVTAGASASLGYNSRSGSKDLTLGASFNPVALQSKTNLKLSEKLQTSVSTSMSSSTSISYNTEPINPSIQVPYNSSYSSFSFDLGGTLPLVFAGGGATGYRSIRYVKNKTFKRKAYGFLYVDEAKKAGSNAVMDFTREKENPVIPELPNLALPVHTPDLFSYTSQGGSGQFRLYRSTGAFGDAEVVEESSTSTAGFDLGAGPASWHIGSTFFEQDSKNSTRRWNNGSNENPYLNYGDFQAYDKTRPQDDHVYFKLVGDKGRPNATLAASLDQDKLLSVDISGKSTKASFIGQSGLSSSALKQTGRASRSTMVSYLTAEEAAAGGLNKKILVITNKNDYATFPAIGSAVPLPIEKGIDRYILPISPATAPTDPKKNHISEITITDPAGKRSVYGVPVYNTKQEEYSFAIGNNYSLNGTPNQTTFTTIDNGTRPYHSKGIDHYYHKESQAPYATSHLLSGILSPDYMDMTEDGISPDDAGTAIKFNYTFLDYKYKWRTPYSLNTATVNKGLLAEPEDDKASIVYGEKELCYLHTIETKNKIAYFILREREDGLGVKDWKGGMDDKCKQMRLEEIRLYSKGDLERPIKVVKFEYDYSLCPNTPNSLATGKGKLTLKRVSFQYGMSKKGAKNYYEFNYFTGTTDNSTGGYKDMSTDRWGTYKHSSSNINSGQDNDQFPYSLQTDSVKAAANASLWNLQTIGLPSGGKINIVYESDDYAYVQNKRAMIMSKIEGVVKGNGDIIPLSENTWNDRAFYDAEGFRIKLQDKIPESEGDDLTGWFKKNYLSGTDYLYTKMYTNMVTLYNHSNGRKQYEFIPCYAKVIKVSRKASADPDAPGEVNVFFEMEDGMNPIVFSAWQRLRMDYPEYAYRGYENRAKDGDAGIGLQSAIEAISEAVNIIGELKENYNSRARRNGFAGNILLSKSFVRLTKFDGKKLGGGCRVKQIRISDEWKALTTSGSTAEYGQEYDYRTIAEGNEKPVSSGVASYEPSIGNDENPLKQPIEYVQSIKGAVNNTFSLEQPFGESFFPGAAVIYSKVTVRDIAPQQTSSAQVEYAADKQQRTGYVVNEFFTAKDFPVRVRWSTIKPVHHEDKDYAYFSASTIDELCLTQGYVIELNDMPGKSKATRIFNQSGAQISSTEYHYHSEKVGKDEMRLKNSVSVVNENGKVEDNVIIGRDIDFFTDMREQESRNKGTTVQAGVDFVAALIVIPIPHLPIKENSEYKLFRSACAVKVVQDYGMIEKVVKTENGSSISTENIAYDELTGEPIVTRTQNEFDEYVYSLNMPAYWAYKGMGGAYQTEGMFLTNLKTSSDGSIPNFSTVLKSGDQLIDIKNKVKYWVIETDGAKRLINKEGRIQAGVNIEIGKIQHSGYGNKLSESTFNLTCLNNPIGLDHYLVISNSSDGLLTNLKVLNSSAQTFDDKWAGSPLDLNYETVYHKEDRQYYIWGRIVENQEGVQPYCLPRGAKCLLEYYAKLEIYFYKGYSPNSPPPFVQANLIGFNGSFLLKSHQSQRFLRNFFGNQSMYTFVNLHPDKYRSGLSYIYLNNEDGTRVETNNTYFTNDNDAYLGTIKVVKQGIETVDVGEVKPIPFNPYLQGYLRNPKIAVTKAFQGQRHHSSSATSKLSNGGYMPSFTSYWYKSALGSWTESSSAKWITSNTITSYDKYGQELENKDVLGNYSAAKFDFGGELPSAVASNAMNREIYANSFEERLKQDTVGHKEFRRYYTYFGDISQGHTTPIVENQSINELPNGDTPHSGNRSIQVPVEGVTMHTTVYDEDPATRTYFTIDDASKAYLIKPESKRFTPIGFQPRARKYIFNAWIKNYSDDKLKLYINDKEMQVLKYKVRVEGWKLVEGVLDFTGIVDGTDVVIRLKAVDSGGNSGSILIDDMRIYPEKAQMKTYVYSSYTFRFLAELDENCFATFYEYDDEGNLARVKKETEKGIVTLKESRSSYKKKP